LAVHRIDEQLWAQAETIFLRHADACLSFTDCTSFALLNERMEMKSSVTMPTSRWWGMSSSRGGSEEPHRTGPICGGGDPSWADRLRDVPIWVFHGARDRIVPPEYSEVMVAALKRLGADVRCTRYPDAQHDSWTRTYENPDLYELRWASSPVAGSSSCRTRADPAHGHPPRLGTEPPPSYGWRVGAKRPRVMPAILAGPFGEGSIKPSTPNDVPRGT
jgi:hypothetical protein